MRIRSFLLMAAVLVAVPTIPFADAQEGPGGDVNTVVVEKVVVGPVPPGSVFEVLLSCTPLPSSPAETIAPVTFQFDENGDPIGSNSVGVGAFEACTIVETVTNGAAVTYECAMAVPAQGVDTGSEGPAPASCSGGQDALFVNVAGATATFTVTNTYEEEPPPPDVPDDELPDVVADVVTATPPFTG